jgi:SAM-dependent methyltransferase
MPPSNDTWVDGIASELDFWSRWLETKGLGWPADYAFRTDPHAEIGGIAGEYLASFHGTPRILDVGAGPMTALGKRLNGVPVELTAVDALAHFYDGLKFAEGLPLVRTQKCDSEKLSEKFPPNTFDLTYAQNTLDHSYDPMAAIQQMIYVTKLGGLIITSHAANEAINENWQGFHQWNFYVTGRDFKIANRTETLSVKRQFGNDVAFIDLSPDGESWVNCVMRKNGGHNSF